MANTNAPFGFQPLGVSEGSAPTFALSKARVAAANATKIFRGDPVKALATGYIAQSANGTDVAITTGIFWSCKYLSTSQGRTLWSTYWPGADATGDVECEIISFKGGPSQRFRVQAGAVALTIADINGNVDFAIGTGSTVTGLSGAFLSPTGAETTVSLPFRIVDLWPGLGAGSDPTTPFNWVTVESNFNRVAGV